MIIITIDNNHFIEIPIAENLQIEEIHKNSQKIDLIDQTVKITNIETIIQDQIRTDFITQLIIETVLIQNLELDIIQMTVPEIPHKIETGITQTIETDHTQIIDHKTIQTTDQTKILITIELVTIPGIKVLVIQVD